jgi:hypothetical protein
LAHTNDLLDHFTVGDEQVHREFSHAREIIKLDRHLLINLGKRALQIIQMINHRSSTLSLDDYVVHGTTNIYDPDI